MRSSPALPTSLYALLMLCAGRLDERTATAQILVENAEQRAVSYVESGARIPAASRASGASAEVSSEIVWRPMCGSPAGALTRDDLRRIAESQRQMSNAAGAAVTASQPASASPSGGFDLVLNLMTSFPPEALEALADLEKYIESRFADPIQVHVNISFASTGGALGATGISYVQVPWATVRDGLQADMDGSDAIQAHLPSGGTIPVRYDANSAAITAESVVYVPIAAYKAAIGEVAGVAASIVISNGTPWDYTPPTINSFQYSFRDIVLHEFGHALGFISAVDTRTFDIELLDIYRFSRSDGAANYNPDTVEEFASTPRTVDRDPPSPTTSDDVVSDIIEAEYRMSDGLPNQGSHFESQTPGIYLMDPVFVHQETFYPDYLRAGDVDMLDAIGWDYPAENISCDAASPLGCGLRHFDNSLAGGAVDPPFPCGAAQDHAGAVWFSFVATSTAARLSTCGSLASGSTLAVYEGECGTLTEIACSEDDGCGGPGLSQVCLNDLSLGQTYYVQVASRSAAELGIFALELTCSCDAICADFCCSVADGPEENGGSVPHCRYASLVPGNPSRQTALRVTFDTLYNPQPPNPPSVIEPDFSTYEGLHRWVGPPMDFVDGSDPPQMFRAAKLQCTPYFHDWSTEGVVYLTGPEIVPSSTYIVQAVDERCLQAEAGEDAYSEALLLTTARWGDVSEPFQDPGAATPTQPNVIDVARVVDKLKGVAGAYPRTRVQLQPHDPLWNSQINVIDVGSAVDAIKLARYPFAGPQNCP